jgi:hypothetical protein
MAIQKEIYSELKKQGFYAGRNAFKENIITWLEDPARKVFINACLKKSKWSKIPQSNADEILKSLNSGEEVGELIEYLFEIGADENIGVFDITADGLINWIKDIIDKNDDLNIVFIWDEFSDYLNNNKNTLTEFQKIVELVNVKPFYFVIVTHESGHLFDYNNKDKDARKLSDRFIKTTISLPDSIAFDLMSCTFNVKDNMKDQWKNAASALNDRVSQSRRAVGEEIRVDSEVIKKILPLHPMAALLLKNISETFKSNQRSMFDFLKEKANDGVKAFQWFICNYGPESEEAMFNVDMLWDFFYEKGKNDLDRDIRKVLDAFGRYQDQDLQQEEENVLKTILIMQAINEKFSVSQFSTGGIKLFNPTQQNLSYVFEGSNLEDSYSGIIGGLVEKKILICVSNKKEISYSVAVLAGDEPKIEELKEKLKQTSTTAYLINNSNIGKDLHLLPPLSLRFEGNALNKDIETVTRENFKQTMSRLKENNEAWKIQAVIAFAKNEDEAENFRRDICLTARDEQYKNIVFIDALSTPLNIDDFKEYIEYSARAQYYLQCRDDKRSQEFAVRAREILNINWKDKIYKGRFIVYYENNEGRNFANVEQMIEFLCEIVKRRFPLAFDFEKGLTEAQFKNNNLQFAAKCGITCQTKGILNGIENHIIKDAWKIEQYWKKLPDLQISKIKIDLDKLIEKYFNQEGQISIGEIYNFLESKYGFSPCNLYAFITGFLLKEFSSGIYRFSDSHGAHGVMDCDKLAEMIAGYIDINKRVNGGMKYIVKMTEDEKAFYKFTEDIWNIEQNSCSSVAEAQNGVRRKIRELLLPVWCLSEIADEQSYNIISKYIELVKADDSREAHQKLRDIGKVALGETAKILSKKLRELINPEKCQQAMQIFLQKFEDGKIIKLAADIGATDIIFDISKFFEDVEFSYLWNKQTGGDEIKKLQIQYSIVKESNSILQVRDNSFQGSIQHWREYLKSTHFSCQVLQLKFPQLKRMLEILLKIYKREVLSDIEQKEFLVELMEHLDKIKEILNDDANNIFSQIYAPYIETINIDEIKKIDLPIDMFSKTNTECNKIVKEAVEKFYKNQLKIQALNFWQEKTSTKTPIEWSQMHRTPILCCVKPQEFTKAKNAFEILNEKNSTRAENEISQTLEWLKSTNIFETLADKNLCDEAFRREIIESRRNVLLPDLKKVRDALDNLANVENVYAWYGNPNVKEKIKQLAQAAYDSGASDEALRKIDNLDHEQIKEYFRKLIKENIDVGIEILSNGQEKESGND